MGARPNTTRAIHQQLRPGCAVVGSRRRRSIRPRCGPLVTSDDQLRGDLDLSILQAATHHDAHTLTLRPTVPGIGTILSLVRLEDIHDMARCPSVPDVVSYGRRLKWAQASAGKCLGTSGQQMGNAHLTWAFSEAAMLCLRHNPAGQNYLARLANTHDKGKAVTSLAHKLARAL